MKESNEILDFASAIASGITAAKADGNVDWLDLPKLAPILAKARAAIEGTEQLPKEFETASVEEITEFAKHSLEVLIALVGAVITK